MAKTLLDLIAEARSIIGQTEENNSSITNAQMKVWANEAYRKILVKMKSIPKQINELTAATGDIPVNTNTLSIDEAYILNPTTNDYDYLEIVDLNFLKFISNSWLTDDVGVPRYFVRKDTFSYYLYPQPNTDYVGKTIKTIGLQFPADMSLDTDTPSKLPLNLQELIPHYMAYRAFLQINREQDGANELITFRSALKSALSISVAGNISNMKFRFTEVDE